MRILAIDPGPEKSAFVSFKDGVPDGFDIVDNVDMLRDCYNAPAYADGVVIEQVASYGKPVGAEVFETVFWSGRFAEAVRSDGLFFERLTRAQVKMHLCHTMKGVNDSVIRQAMLDRFGPGREKAIGTKKNPGPCYGMKEDIWQALALGVVWFDKRAAAVPGSV